MIFFAGLFLCAGFDGLAGFFLMLAWLETL